MNRKEQRRQEWTVRVADYQASGLTMKAWCDAQGITKDQLRYWLRALKSPKSAMLLPAPPPPSFVPLRLTEPTDPPSEPSLLLHVGYVRVEVKTGFDPALLRDVVNVLTAAPC